MSEQNQPTKAPRLFISYSWTDQAHVDWVMQLATDLKRYGVDVVIDKWHLKEGQDAHSFMEKLVRSGEIDKAALICDLKYVDRANKREGGVGAESQIITASIYEDVGQTKFAAVVTQANDDGSPCLPNFLSSRIYIDFRDPEQYAERVTQLVRWAFDKPLYREPELGPRPAFLDEQIDFDPIRIPSGSGIGHNSDAAQNLVRFFEEAIRSKTDFTPAFSEDEANDETIYKSILSLAPLAAQILSELSVHLVERELTDVELDRVIDYFSALYGNYDKGPTNWSGDVTKFFGETILTAALGKMIRNRRFETAQRLLGSSLLKISHSGVTAEAKPLKVMNTYLRSLEARNSRLGLRRLSLHADLIKEFCELARIDFVEYMQADLVLYFNQSRDENEVPWWPDSLIYATDTYGSFPWFAKATESRYRDSLMPLIGVWGKPDLEQLLEKIRSQSLPRIHWSGGFSTVDAKRLANLDAILNSYS